MLETKLIPGFAVRHFCDFALWGTLFGLGVLAMLSDRFSTPRLIPVLFVVWAVGFRRQQHRFQCFVCPQCSKDLRREKTETGTRIVFECPDCNVEWDTGFTQGGGD